MKKILILEDNPVISRKIEMVAGDISKDLCVCSFDNTKDAYKFSIENMIDLFIVDIILDTSHPGDTSGLYFVEKIRNYENYKFIPVIFVTSLIDEKMYTYDKLHCYSFIEKPFDAGALKLKISECLKFPTPKRKKQTLYFRKDGIIIAVDKDDVILIESMRHEISIYTSKDDNIKIRYYTLKELMEIIDDDDFIQCSKSMIFNRKYLDNIDFARQMLKLKKIDKIVNIGYSYRKNIKDKLKCHVSSDLF